MTSNHPHGHYLRYLHGPNENNQPGQGCRCTPCRTSAATHMAAYRQYKAREQWGAAPPLMVDAEPARTHVRSLMAAGIPLKTIAGLAGVGEGGAYRLIYGSAPTPPTRRLTRRVAERLLAVRTEDALALDGYIDAAGTVRRVQALVAVGWTLSEIARRIGMNPRAMTRFLASKRVSTNRARQIRALYGDLWNRRPPAENAIQRRDVKAAREMARRKGWPPPGAWDDDLLDLPEAELGAEVVRRVGLMSDEELAACHTAHYKQGDLSPLVVAAAKAYAREASRVARQRKAAAREAVSA